MGSPLYMEMDFHPIEKRLDRLPEHANRSRVSIPRNKGITFGLLPGGNNLQIILMVKDRFPSRIYVCLVCQQDAPM